ncbi:hypothetical protein ACQ4M3_19200 [Leptolyngbya sp. AN03gr2]|uniref:hypothetical protein n=1 Tax=Leptolyngbya sp. AN03gr2 TaxID=3423364 RepID=UPI003D322E60
MANSIKAVRAQIDLGGILLNVYQLPDGTYRLAGRNVTDAIEANDSSLREIMGVKSLKHLPGADLTLSEIRAETGEKFIPVSISDAAVYWGHMANKGNRMATAILVASSIEAIERRADSVFGVQREETERNNLFQQRMKTILTRRKVTDAVQEYRIRNEIPDHVNVWMYKNTTDGMYKSVFGMSAKQIEDFFGCPNGKLRDHLDLESLIAIEFAENLICRLINQDVEPVRAVKEAVRIASIEQVQPKVKVS